MRTLAAILATLLLALAPARAEALTLRDIVELHRSGLSDDVLVALIEVNRAIYTLDAEVMKQLKADGLSDRVLIAIVNSGRASLPLPQPVVAPAPEPEPHVVVIHHRDEPRPPAVVIQQVPVYVPVPAYRPAPRRVQTSDPSPGSPYYVGQVPDRSSRPEPKPVYWGFGGKLRPDAWGQPASRGDRKDDRKDDRGGGGT